MNNKRLFHRLMFIIFVIILFFGITSLLAFSTYLKPPKIHSEITPKDLGLPYENISFQTADGITLRGWFIPSTSSGQAPRSFDNTQDKQAQIDTTKTIIGLHGWPADKGNILPALSFLTETYNLFVFDFRGLGESEGKYSTIGVKETQDLKAAIQYLESRDIEEVGVWGFSMGGAVALMTAQDNPQIKAIISEASYARLDLMTSEAFKLPLLRHPLGFLTSLWAKLILGIDIRKAAPMEAVKQLQIPILIIHSSNDEVIPFSHAELLKGTLKNNSKAEFWFQENLFHGQLNKEYQQRIEDFYKRNL